MSMWTLLTISTNCTGWCNFVVFEKFTSAYNSHQIAREILSLPVNNVHEKTSQKVKTDKILKACTWYL